MGFPRRPNGWYILPQSDMYMGSSEGKHCQQHGVPSPSLPWSPGWISTGLGLGRSGLRSPVQGRPANLAKAQLYPRCSARSSAPLSLDGPAHGPIPVLGEDEGLAAVPFPVLSHKCSRARAEGSIKPPCQQLGQHRPTVQWSVERKTRGRGGRYPACRALRGGRPW